MGMYINQRNLTILSEVENMFSVHDVIETALEAESKKHEHRPRKPGVFFPTDSFKCPRQVYYSVISPELAAVDRLPLGLFHMAKKAEEGIIEMVRVTYGDALVEQQYIDMEVAPGIQIHGYLDFAIKNAKGKISHVFEVKSTANISYTMKEEKAKIHHRGQLQVYLQCLKVLTGSVVYVERGDLLKMKQFEEEYDEELWTLILDKFKHINEAMERGEPPEPDPTEKWECRYCSYQKVCSETRTDKQTKAKRQKRG
jgi:CRISPR/Cas system-associated exonuclease Cas4 (RecB family)